MSSCFRPPRSETKSSVSSQITPIVTCSAVETGEREERGAEHVGREAKSLVIELGELEVLAAEEDRAQQRGCRDPDAGGPKIASLQTGQGEHHRQRAHQEHEGRDRGVGNIDQFVRVRPDARPPPRPLPRRGRGRSCRWRSGRRRTCSPRPGTATSAFCGD